MGNATVAIIFTFFVVIIPEFFTHSLFPTTIINVFIGYIAFCDESNMNEVLMRDVGEFLLKIICEYYRSRCVPDFGFYMGNRKL